MARRIFQILRGPGTSKPVLATGEFYLDTTNDVLFLQGKNGELRFALQTDLNGYFPKTGGTVTGNTQFGVDENSSVDVTIHGNLHLGTSSSETRRLVFGDGTDLVYIAEPDDDYLKIHASNGITIDSDYVEFTDMDEPSPHPLPVNQGGTGKTTALTAADVGALPSDGTAVSASKLATAGTVRVSLGSTSSVTYTNGGNITPGVSGLLPVANGGTGINNAQPMRKYGTVLGTTWSGSAGNYTQNITVTGITASAVPIVIPQIASTAQQDAWNLLNPIVKANAGSITFYSATPTTTSVSIIVLWAV